MFRIDWCLLEVRSRRPEDATTRRSDNKSSTDNGYVDLFSKCRILSCHIAATNLIVDERSAANPDDTEYICR